MKKKQIDQSEDGTKPKKNEIIPFEDMVQIKTKFKMREMDLNLEKTQRSRLSDHENLVDNLKQNLKRLARHDQTFMISHGQN